MIINLIITNLFTLAVFIALVCTVIKIKKFQEDTKKTVFKQISNLIKLVEKIQKQNATMRKDTTIAIQNIHSDIDKLFMWNKYINKAITDQMELHNELVDITYESFKDIFCDMNDGDCSTCDFYEKCSAYSDEKDGFDEGPELYKSSISTIPEGSEPIASGVIVGGPCGRFVLSDPDDEVQLNKLREALKASGMPAHLVEEAMKQVIATLKRVTQSATTSKQEKVVKKVDPIKKMKSNSKIIASLEKIFKQSS